MPSTYVQGSPVACNPPDAKAPSPDVFRRDIQVAKGFAIFLVVFGHIVTGPIPEGAQWYMSMRTVVYAFHMPFFMALSGYVFYYANSLAKGRSDPLGWIQKRAKRLLVPFVIFGVFIVFGKHLFSAIGYVDNISSSIIIDLTNIVWHTPFSAAKSIWYVFVLFEISVIALVVSRFIDNPLIIFFLTMMLVPFSPLMEYLYLDRLLLYMPFFFLGGALARRGDAALSAMDRYLAFFFVLFCVAIIATRLLSIWVVSLYVCGIISIPVILGLCRRPTLADSAVLRRLGEMSFVIYLLNTVFIGLAKAGLRPFVPWGGSGFPIYFVVLLAAGILGPIAIKILVFRRMRVLDEMTS